MALVQDLKQRGMLDDTLVIWGGEFGRTIYSQGKLTPTDYGRDHHPRCFTMWMAGGGIKGGIVHGETDEFSYNIVRDPVHVRDFQATILHLFGIDHERFTFRYQGLGRAIDGRGTGESCEGADRLTLNDSVHNPDAPGHGAERRAALFQCRRSAASSPLPGGTSCGTRVATALHHRRCRVIKGLPVPCSSLSLARVKTSRRGR